ncbi:histone-lysine N-methyltransferase EZH2 isoform X3 [Eurytemora carolleeae]|uniref:histone-lysine N-methyltransferase EZH2 isoform X3 n=1 Tax=Eurytemora carolleeae TaxID=1294199 RepID=UPI000C76A90F|nr:histone-lysine N-methyltransferase EZH2 isoform X3 [Eurytemora carolleeae]|eukprot:XP_023342365.1 histone-lysine N-methyltransferase EZH2-like isoform X3 [Eurytemora affinis]
MDENVPEIVWKKRVEIELNKLTEEPKTKTDLLRNAWRKNLDLVVKEKTLNTKPVLFDREWFPAPPKSGGSSKLCKLTSGSKEVVDQIRILEIPAVSPIPTLSTWVPIQRNILPDKETPTNIPYFGDEVIEKDTHFIESMVEEVYLVNQEEEEKFNLTDDVFMKLIAAVNSYREEDPRPGLVLHHPGSNAEMDYYSESQKNIKLPGLIVFQAVELQFPELGSVQELISRFKMLREGSDREHFAPNIDSEQAGDLSAEETLHSYKSLLCRRCFLFDCPLHRDDPVLESPIQRPHTRDVPLSTEPCSSRCYLNNPGHTALLSPRTPMVNKLKGNKSSPSLYDEGRAERVANLLNPSGTQTDVWTNAEKSLFRVLILSFPGNFCAIAQIMATKKCNQVFEFSVQEGKTSRGERKMRNLKARKFGKTQQAKLYKHTQGGKKENKRPYFPCNHPGLDCAPEVCSCIENNNFCEKFCLCPPTCSHRFPGCRCKSNCKTSKCSCFLGSRECDPDLCLSCLDGKPELNPETNSCQNVYLQRMMGKTLFVAPSDIAGFGCFIGEIAEKNDFIAEYVGEMITQEESESRGRVYDMAKSSYMFNLNEEYIVDAARFGGNIRFANHSSKPNCQVKILLVNGDYRIGIYAKERIELGAELFFDYGKDFIGHDLI